MAHRNAQRLRSLLIASAAAHALMMASAVQGQTYYTWGSAGSDWTNAGNWSPGSGPPGVADFAQFFSPTGGSVNPVLNSSATVAQLTLLRAPVGGWTLSGSGLLSAGIQGGYDPSTSELLGVAGLMAWPGAGDFTINLGNGSATSLALSGAPNVYGQLNLCYGSRLILTGNTVATLNSTPVLVNPGTGAMGIPPTLIRGGTLVLDNSAGNPVGARWTSGSSVMHMYGGGSAVELRGAASGTSFSGLATINIGGGQAYIRTVQSGSGALSAAFPTISRATGRHFLFFENIGSGFVGDPGKPAVTAGGTPNNFSVNQSFSGVISASTTAGAPWVMVTNRATDSPSATVTGRWANYNSGIVASSPTSYSGDFSGAAANTNVLFAPNTPGTTNLTASTNQLASLVFEPTVSGATLALGANKINALGVALSGANDLTVTGGSLVDDSSLSAARNIIVLNPTTSLVTNSNLANSSNSSIAVGGKGFLVLNGTSNQIPFTSASNLFLNGGVLRVNTSSFVPTNTNIGFRGGTLEYDVSGGNAAITFPVSGGGAGNVTWAIFANGESSNTDVGGGGFSAYAGAGNGNGNTLTVNLGGSSAPLTWSAGFFVPSYYALKFGSLKSNATVDFQNPINLGTGIPAENGINRNRLIEVTRGVGNAADKTLLSGVISGDAGYDLVKSGSGVLETTAANTYNGNTVVTGGELRIKGGYSGSGGYVVNGGNLLITQSAWNPVMSGSGAVVNQGKLVLDYTGTSSPFNSLRPLLNASDAGGYEAGQFRSVLADTSVGLGSKDDGASLFTIQAAYFGDADLDGKVNTLDFNQLAAGFGNPGQWSAGNFNYDLIVDSVDFTRLVSNFGKSAPIGAAAEQLVLPGSVVPEPQCLAVLAFAAVGLRLRRAR